MRDFKRLVPGQFISANEYNRLLAEVERQNMVMPNYGGTLTANHLAGQHTFSNPDLTINAMITTGSGHQLSGLPWAEVQCLAGNNLWTINSGRAGGVGDNPAYEVNDNIPPSGAIVKLWPGNQSEYYFSLYPPSTSGTGGSGGGGSSFSGSPSPIYTRMSIGCSGSPEFAICSGYVLASGTAEIYIDQCVPYLLTNCGCGPCLYPKEIVTINDPGAVLNQTIAHYYPLNDAFPTPVGSGAPFPFTSGAISGMTWADTADHITLFGINQRGGSPLTCFQGSTLYPSPDGMGIVLDYTHDVPPPASPPTELGIASTSGSTGTYCSYSFGCWIKVYSNFVGNQLNGWYGAVNAFGFSLSLWFAQISAGSGAWNTHTMSLNNNVGTTSSGNLPWSIQDQNWHFFGATLDPTKASGQQVTAYFDGQSVTVNPNNMVGGTPGPSADGASFDAPPGNTFVGGAAMAYHDLSMFGAAIDPCGMDVMNGGQTYPFPAPTPPWNESGAIGPGALSSGAVESGNLGAGSVNTMNITLGAVTKTCLANPLDLNNPLVFQLRRDWLASGNLYSGELGCDWSGGKLWMGASGGNVLIGPTVLASGTVTSGELGAYAVNTINLNSGAVDITKVVSGFQGSGLILAGRIGSGQILSGALGSGCQVDFSEVLIEDQYTAGEPISGVRAVCFNTSGFLRIAMPDVPGRMPAIGIVFQNIQSGGACTVVRNGRVYTTAFDYAGGTFRTVWSGHPGNQLYVYTSGDVNTSAPPNGSGVTIQAVAEIINNSGFYVNPAPAIQSIDGKINWGTGAYQSPHFAFQIPLNSPTWNQAINFGNMALGSVGSGQILSGCIGALQLLNFSISGQAINSGAIDITKLVSGLQISGLVLTGGIGSGALTSGLMASGFIAALVSSVAVASGSITSGELASGLIANLPGGSSGTITTSMLASGCKADASEWSFDDSFIAAEAISGVRAVVLNLSGQLNIAKSAFGASGLMPAIGVVVDNVLSGAACTVYTRGRVSSANLSGMISGGNVIWTGRSGEITSLPLSTGMGNQCLGVGVSNSEIYLNPQSIGIDTAGGLIISDQGQNRLTVSIQAAGLGSQAIGTAAIVSGKIGSGAVMGQNATGGWNIVSGSIGNLDIGAFAINGNNLASGIVDITKVVSGFQGSGLILSGRIAVGAIGGRHLASGTIIDLHAFGDQFSMSGNIAGGAGGPGNLISRGLTAQTSIYSMKQGQYQVAEMISGFIIPWVPVVLNLGANGSTAYASGNATSGNGGIYVAMAGLSGRCPATGFVYVPNGTALTSGSAAYIFTAGQILDGVSPLPVNIEIGVLWSGYMGPVYLAQSGGFTFSQSGSPSNYTQVMGGIDFVQGGDADSLVMGPEAALIPGSGIKIMGGGLGVTIAATPVYPFGHIGGLTTVYTSGTTTSGLLQIKQGSAVDTSGVANLVLNSTLSKTLQSGQSWASGMSGAIYDFAYTLADLRNGWLHIHAISDGNVTDVIATCATASGRGLFPIMPAGFTYARRIATLNLNGSGIVTPYKQVADEFLYNAPQLDVNGTNVGTAAVNVSLSVPPGIQPTAIFNIRTLDATTNNFCYVSSPDQDDIAPGTGTGAMTTVQEVAATNAVGGWLRIRTNASGQLRVRNSIQSGATIIGTMGYVDLRGKDNTL